MDVLDEKRNGVSLADCAEIMAQDTELKTQHGEMSYKPHFQQFLRSKGLTENSWAHAWNEWWNEMQSNTDLAAKFHTFQAQYRTNQMIAKQPNVSGDVLEGVSLEQYAKISAQIAQGAVAEGVIAGEGLSMDQWVAGQAAWGQKMGTISPTDPIMLQYGKLYQKYSPNHQAMMEASTKAILDDHNSVHGNSSITLNLDNADEFWNSDIVRFKARGVREMINLWDRSWDEREGDPRFRQHTQKAFDIAIDLLENGPGVGPGYEGVDAVDPIDIHTFSATHQDEEAYEDTVTTVLVLGDLAGAEFMTPEQSERAQAAHRKAIERLSPRKAKVEALFGGVTDDLKKVQLRSLLDGYISVLEDLQEELNDWDYQGPKSGEEATASPSSSAAGIQPAQEKDAGIMKVLKSLPIIGPLLRMLGL